MNSKFSRILWTLNGIGIFIALILTGIDPAIRIINNLSEDEFETGLIVPGKNVGISNLDSIRLELQHIVYDSPRRIDSSDYYLAEVTIFDKKMPDEVKQALSEAAQISEKIFGATINILFFKEDRSEVYTLLDRNAYIELESFPGERNIYDYHGEVSKIKQPFIIYEIAMNDDNNDKRINGEDNMSYYMSDERGKNLEKITPDSLKFFNFWFTWDYKEIYFEAVKDIKVSEDLPYMVQERDLYYYNIAQKRFAKFDQINEELNKVRENFIKN